MSEAQGMPGFIPPNSDPTGADNTERLEAERNALLHVLMDVNACYDSAREWQMLFLMRPRLPGVIMEFRPWVLFGEDRGAEGPMKGPYERLLLEPQPQTNLSQDIAKIVARKPYIDPDDTSHVLPEGADDWKDLSLEVTFTDGRAGLYWLNTEGVIPYKDKWALREIPVPTTPDLYFVDPSMSNPTAPPLDIIALAEAFREKEVKLKTQENDPDLQ